MKRAGFHGTDAFHKPAHLCADARIRDVISPGRELADVSIRAPA